MFARDGTLAIFMTQAACVCARQDVELGLYLWLYACAKEWVEVCLYSWNSVFEPDRA